MWQNGQWVVNSDIQNPNYPEPPVGTVFPDDWGSDVVNAHPYQVTGVGTPMFARHSARGENDGWQAATFINREDIMLIKDDLVWSTKNNFTTNHSEVSLSPIDVWFPSLHNHIMDNGKTLYQDIFENGRIQSITRTRTSSNNIMPRSNFYIIYYTDGSDDERSNKAFMVETGASVIGGGSMWDEEQVKRYMDNNNISYKEEDEMKELVEILKTEEDKKYE